jgi:hypothetical protein
MENAHVNRSNGENKAQLNSSYPVESGTLQNISGLELDNNKKGSLHN